MLLTDKQIEKYSDILQNIEDIEYYDYSYETSININDETYEFDCNKLAQTSAKSFETNKKGFKAVVERDRKNLVFFSVPYDEGWTATVNGKKVEIEKVNANLNKFETELESLEKEHKQKVIDLRAKDKGKVSKDTDKEFKRFAQKRTVIAEKIASLKKQIESLKSPEYLIGLEKKIYAQEEAKRKELLKESKKLNKNNEKRG